MANHAIDSDHEIEEEMQKIESEQPKQKGNLLKTRKQKEKDRWLMKKIYEDKKRTKKLMLQKNKCIDDDKLANDEERVAYETSVDRMREAMDILQKNERESIIGRYLQDWKTLMATKKKISTTEKIADKND
jgi:hypothetical protein